MKVLVWPAFSVVGIEIAEQLQYTKNIQLFGGSSFVNHPLKSLYHQVVQIEDSRTENPQKLLPTLENFVIFPAHDYVLDFISANADSLEWIGSPRETIQITRDKGATYQQLRNNGLSDLSPNVYTDAAISTAFPIYAKPNSGYGSQGHFLIETTEEFIQAVQKDLDLVFVENLLGDEYTIECFTDRNRDLIYTAARMRSRVRMGTSFSFVQPSIEVESIFKDIANQINRIFELNGPWYFQAKAKNQNGKDFKILEISSRIPGSVVWSRAQGVNIAELGIWNHQFVNVFVQQNNSTFQLEREISSKLILSSDYSHVYVDLDDTLIRKGKIDPWGIAFLIQEKNSGKSIHLITKSLTTDLDKTLRENHLLGIFSSISHLDLIQEKRDFVLNRDSIFIDDSFTERQRVSEVHGIPCFGPDIFRIMVI